ncbi:innexin inx2-like [Sitodiplosis mosellana]|uniref:innexin inx2-like n=1 Tax=Sitodiplosis mosellana TaxID=263140 RepID=UPI002444B47A|nr:innexin inx2-like [Sitodiplosis mosellana]
MVDAVVSLKMLFKSDRICSDNFIFRLHCKITVIILITLSLFIISNQFIGEQINCNVGEIPSNVIISYCWLLSTYADLKWKKDEVSRVVVQPVDGSFISDENGDKYYKFYQWVYFALLLQAALFYIPKQLWKFWGGWLVEDLVDNLNLPIVDADYKTERKEIIINYFETNMGQHNIYAIRYLICLNLNLINVIMQMYFIDYFFGGEFSCYGFETLKFIQMRPDDRFDPMNGVFPKTAKCVFSRYDPSGNIVNLNTLCVLRQNVINEQIYVFLWFWFYFVCIMSAFSVVYYSLIFIFPCHRSFLTESKQRFISFGDMEKFTDKLKFGDWLLLYHLSKNIDASLYKEILKTLSTNMDQNETFYNNYYGIYNV